MSTKRQVSRFLVIGVTAVGIDFVSYHILMWFGVIVGVAKAIGFVCGTIFSYFMNRNWTFAIESKRLSTVISYCALYAFSLFVNVEVNDTVIALVSPSRLAILAGFLAATIVSATLNFIGMKYVVFSRDLADLKLSAS